MSFADLIATCGKCDNELFESYTSKLIDSNRTNELDLSLTEMCQKWFKSCSFEQRMEMCESNQTPAEMCVELVDMDGEDFDEDYDARILLWNWQMELLYRLREMAEDNLPYVPIPCFESYNLERAKPSHVYSNRELQLDLQRNDYNGNPESDAKIIADYAHQLVLNNIDLITDKKLPQEENADRVEQLETFVSKQDLTKKEGKEAVEMFVLELRTLTDATVKERSKMRHFFEQESNEKKRERAKIRVVVKDQPNKTLRRFEEESKEEKLKRVKTYA